MKSLIPSCLMLSLLASGVIAGAAPLVKNGDFGIDAKLEGWRPGHAAYKFTDEEGYNNPGAILFTGPAPAEALGPSQEIVVRPNTDYVLSAALKSDGRLAPSVQVRKAEDSTVVAASTGAVRVWTPVLVRFNSGANGKLTVVCIAANEAAPEGARAWFDDIAVLLPEEVPTGRSVQGGFMTRPGENLAKGCKYALEPAPNYGYCTDPGDATQLTDGEYTSGYFWVQKGTVGWCVASPVLITIDLGTAQPIAGLSYNTAGGCAGVGWPSAVLVSVSEDQKEWRYAGDLVVLSAKRGLPAPDHYSVYRYGTGDLQTRGRYVRLAIVTTGGFAFCDEIEIYRGPDSLLAKEPTGEVVTDIKSLVSRTATRSGVFWRFNNDLGEARSALEASKLTEAKKSELGARLDACGQEIPTLPDPDQESFRAIFPLNEVHGRIFSVFGPILRARGLPPFFAWKKQRYDFLTPHEVPDAAPKQPEVTIEMMGDEFRADAFLLTNLTEKPMTVKVQVQGLPGAPRPAWLSISAVPWTDTSHHIPVAAALPEAEYAKGGYVVPVAAGMTRKVWLTVDSSTLKPGRYQGNLLATAAGQRVRLPFSLVVSKVKMGRPRLSLGMWDYTNGDGGYGITKGSLMSAIALERSHFVDCPWAGQGVLPWPGAEEFDANHQLRRTPGFTEFDEWIKRWPDARTYLVFANVADTTGFAGTTIGTAPFDARVGSWAKALADHMRALGLKPQQLGLLLVDEPGTEAGDSQIAGWAKPIKAAAPEITLFEDTAWERPDQTKIQEAITLADILCPYLGRWYTGGVAAQQYYAQRRAAGQRLWFYQASGPARLFDPYRYHRLEAWECFRYGAVGMGFWSFGDIGGGKSSWNEYLTPGTSYSPAFLAPDGATDGVHWQAVREGIEDYEYLAMLRDAAGRTTDANLKAQAEAILAEAPEKVVGSWQADVSWSRSVDRSLADSYRLRVLSLLEKMEQLQAE